MLFSKPRKRRSPFTDPAWDEKTVEGIAEQSCFDVRVTVSTAGRGCSTPSRIDSLYDRSTGYKETYEIHGVLTHPTFSIVSLSFSQSSDPEGCWYYDILDRNEYQDTKVILRKLDICLPYTDGFPERVIHDAHRDAIICGRKFSTVRVFKKKGDGLMSAADKQHGYSYESRYPVLGWITWSDLSSPAIPDWAYEPSDYRFLLDNIPEQPWDLDRVLHVPAFSTKRR